MLKALASLVLVMGTTEAFGLLICLPSLAKQKQLASSARPALRPGRTGLLKTEAKLSAIFFSCDGVLVDSERDGHRVALNRAIAEFEPGLECTEEAYGKLLNERGEERLMAVWKKMGWDGMDMELAEKIYTRKAAIFTEMLETKQLPLRPGVAELVDAALGAGVKLAVCSSNTHRNVKLIVESMGQVRATNIEIFAGNRVSMRKPSPDIYNLAKGTVGVDAADCLVIEDDEVGLEAAKAAHMACLITTSAYTRGDDFKLADRIESSLQGIDLEAVSCLPRSMVGLNA